MICLAIAIPLALQTRNPNRFTKNNGTQNRYLFCRAAHQAQQQQLSPLTALKSVSFTHDFDQLFTN